MEAKPTFCHPVEPVTFSIFSRFCTRPDIFQSPRKRRHPERSASQIYRITQGFMARSRRTPAMLVGRCSSELSGHRLQRKSKSHSLRPERTRISCHVALDRAACAPFRKERRMKFTEATKFYRKSGGAKWRDLRLNAPCAYE